MPHGPTRVLASRPGFIRHAGGEDVEPLVTILTLLLSQLLFHRLRTLNARRRPRPLPCSFPAPCVVLRGRPTIKGRLTFGDNDRFHFGAMGPAMLALFQAATLSAWGDIWAVQARVLARARGVVRARVGRHSRATEPRSFVFRIVSSLLSRPPRGGSDDGPAGRVQLV